jgi:hypothetical protein
MEKYKYFKSKHKINGKIKLFEIQTQNPRKSYKKNFLKTQQTKSVGIFLQYLVDSGQFFM